MNVSFCNDTKQTTMYIISEQRSNYGRAVYDELVAELTDRRGCMAAP